jgi:hypothetical protein
MNKKTIEACRKVDEVIRGKQVTWQIGQDEDGLYAIPVIAKEFSIVCPEENAYAQQEKK